MVSLLALCFVLASCTAVKNAVKDYQLARQDPVIVQEMQSTSANVSALTRGIAGAFPSTSPFADLLGQFAGVVVGIAFGYSRGKKKREG